MEFEKFDDEEAYSDTDHRSSEKTRVEKLLKIEPLELRFTFEANKQISCPLYLSNVTENLVAFKVLTSNVTNFCVKPNTGIILPHTTCGITVIMQAHKEPPADMNCTDKFKIRSVVLAHCATKDIKQMFSKEEKHYIEEHKLPIVYLSTPLPLLPLPKEVYSSMTESGNSNHAEMSTTEFFKFDQQELKFPYEANKHISCYIRVSNMTENHIAFKVKTTHPRKFVVRQNRGVVLPRSTCDIEVIMAAEKALPDLQCKERFLIQSAAVSPSTPEADVVWKMFQDAGLVKERKLRVVYTPPSQAPFAAAEESKECKSPMAFAGKNDNLDVPKATMRSYIQRNLPLVSATFDRIVDSMGLTSRLWFLRNKSSAGYEKLLG